jgi:hypothetical protein
MMELAMRVVASEPDLYGNIEQDTIVQRNKMLVFRLDPDLWDVQEDLRSIPAARLVADQVQLVEVLTRIGVSGWYTRPLLMEELGYLQSLLPSGAWESGVTVVR